MESCFSDHTQELGPSSVVAFADAGAGVPFVGSLHVSPGGKHLARQVVLAPKDIFSCQSDAAALDGISAISDSFTEEVVDSFSLTQRVKKNNVDLAEQKICARRTDKDEDTMIKAQRLAAKRNLETRLSILHATVSCADSFHLEAMGGEVIYLSVKTSSR